MSQIEQPNDEKIVIVGFGWVGQANALALVQMGYQVFYYDVLPPKRHYGGGVYSNLYEKVAALESPLAEDGEHTAYMVCVGDRVDEGGTQDVTFIRQALESIKNAKGTIILRSTIVPKTLSDLTFDYYIPEFLHEKFAIQECIRPYYYVRGSGTRKHDAWLPSVTELWQERAQKVFTGTYLEASHIKYFSNMWNALRIAFANELGDIVADSSKSSAPLEDAERVINFLFEGKSYLRYGRGFGGHCLPKDMRAFLAAYGDERNMAILSGAYESNRIHELRLKEKAVELPEWFSAWDYESIAAHQRKVFEIMVKKLYHSAPVTFIRHLLKPLVLFGERFVPARTPEESRRIWEEKAKANARYYVNQKTASGEFVDESELELSGKEDYERHVASDPLLSDLIAKKGKSMTVLDIGSGIGRMNEAFSRDFQKVEGIDISPTMVNIAKRRLSGLPNVSFTATEGETIPFQPETFDLVFSYLVFQHIDNIPAIERYLKEIHRTLKSGGVAKIQLRTGQGVRRWVWSYGVSLTPETAEQLAERFGFKVVNQRVIDEKNLWLTLIRP
jgi:SAM-dependent methyltransferase